MSLATHTLLELWGVEPQLLNNVEALERCLREAAEAAKCTFLGSLRHAFSPQGASAVLLLAESHVAIHTWPEHAYAALDILTCGQTLPNEGVKVLLAAFKPERYEIKTLNRGETSPPGQLASENPISAMKPSR